jgi:chromosome partitioning protein
MTNKAAVINQKGGTGKTTVTINLGAALTQLGQTVLLMDMDPQGHLTEGVGMQELYLHDSPTLYDALLGNKSVKLSDLIHKSPHETFSVVPSSYQLMLADQALYLARNREHKLKGLFAEIEDVYDWILIDCPPALSNLTDNALNAARQVVIPIQAEATSVRALELLFDQIESIERGLNIHINVLAVVPNLVQDSTISKRILSDLRGQIPTVTPFEMRKRVLLQEAWSKGVSIFAYEPGSNAQGQIQEEIKELYLDLARYIMKQTKGDTVASRESRESRESRQRGGTNG